MRLVVFALLLTLPATTLAAGRTRIAVTEIKSVQGVAPGTATILSDIVVSEVAKGGYEVLSQSDIVAMVGFEKQKKMLGCDETGCLAEIGGALGVAYMLTGQVGQIGTRYRISLMVVDSKKALVVARAAQFCDQNEDALARVAETTVAQVLAAIRGGSELPPPVVAAPAATKPKSDAKPAPAAATATKPAGARSFTTPVLVVGGTGAALLVGGLVVGAMAKSQYNDLSAQQGQPGYYDTYQSEQASIHNKAVAADVMVALGVVGLGVSGYLYYASGTSVSVAAAPTNGGVTLVAQGRF
jgi:TolB-like protein